MVDKCNDPKPFSVPGNGCDVSPMKEGESFRVSDSEKALFDSYAYEQTQIAGTPLDYWTINSVDSPRDPLYGEPIERKFDGPFRMFGVFAAPQVDPNVSEEGLSETFTSTATIPRKSFEMSGIPNPGPGDVLHAWNLPMYTAISTPEANPLEGAGYYFDVLNANPDGYVADSPTFVRWALTLKRRSAFTPERRIQRP